MLILGVSLSAANAVDGHGAGGLIEAAQPVELRDYAIRPSGDASPGGALAALNAAHSLALDFSVSGVSISPANALEPSAWASRLRLDRVGLEPAVLVSPEPVFDPASRRVEYIRAGVVEWYINTPSGLEQGFTLSAPPSRKAGAQQFQIEYELHGDLKPVVVQEGISLALVAPDGRAALRYDHLKAWDSTGRELPAVMGADGHRIWLRIDDSLAVYPVTVDPLLHTEYRFLASDGALDDNFGYSVGVSGRNAIVGAYQNDDGGAESGSVYIFRDTSVAGDWSTNAQIKIIATDDAANDFFGISVAIDGDTAVVGAPGDDDVGGSSGSVYIYQDTSGVGNWSTYTQTKITAFDGTASDSFGTSVAIKGDTIVVGATGDVISGFSSAGSGYIIQDTSAGGDWSSRAQYKTVAPDPNLTAFFGGSCAVHGRTAVFGSTGATGGGAAYALYDTSAAGNWSSRTQFKIVPAGGATSSMFGRSVAVEGKTIVVGANEHDAVFSNAGSAFIFSDTSLLQNWSTYTEKRLNASDAAANDFYGYSVAIQGGLILVGSRNDSVSPGFFGSMWVYEDTGSNGLWTTFSETKIVPGILSGTSGSAFGHSVALDKGIAVSGAYFYYNTVPVRTGASYLYRLQFPEAAVFDGAVHIVDGGGPVDIGNANVGGANPVKTFTVINRGTTQLNTSNLQVPAGYSITEGLNAVIPAGSWDTFTVSLSTAAAGYFTGNVTFDTNDARTPYTFAIKGAIGMAELNILDGAAPVLDETGIVNFGTGTIGGANLVKILTAVNNGYVPLTISSVTPPAGYIVTEPLTGPLAAGGGSDTFTVELTTTTGGTIAGTINIACNDPDENPHNFTLTGVIDGPEARVTFSLADVADGGGPVVITGAQKYAAAITGTFRVHNIGTQALTTSNLTIDGGWTISNGLAASIPAGGFDDITVQRTTNFTGTFPATVSLNSNDLDENPYTFTVTTTVTDLPVRYVDKDAPAGGDGLSWATAEQTITDALAIPACQIWVAEGTYTGGIVIPTAHDLYGGFQGNETLVTQRNPALYPTIIDGNGVPHAVEFTGNNSMLEGFSVTGGYSYVLFEESGGGILVEGRTGIIVSNCRIYGNEAYDMGAGVFLNGSASVTITDCRIGGNGGWGSSTSVDGGGVAVESSPTGSLTITNSIIDGNYGEFGGGLYIETLGTLVLSNTVISGNASTYRGGAAYITGANNVTVTNCTVNGNVANNTGGGLYFISPATAVVSNSIFTNNYIRGVTENTGTSVQLINNLFFNNTTADVFDAVVGNATGAAAINALAGCSGNVAGDPNFEPDHAGTWTHKVQYDIANIITTLTDANANWTPNSLAGRFLRASPVAGTTNTEFFIIGNTATTMTVYGNLGGTFTVDVGNAYQVVNYRQRDGSPAINAGSNAAPQLQSLDIEGAARIQNTTVDIGPYEVNPSNPPLVTFIRRKSPSPTHLSPLRFDVEFNQSVTGVDIADFVIDAVGITGAAVTQVTGSGRFYVVTISTGTANGTLSIDLIDNDSVLDFASTPLGGPGLVNGNFTAGEVYTVTSESEITVVESGATVADGTGLVQFGTANQGAANLVRTFTITNNGTAALSLSGLSLPPGYIVTDPLASPLAAAGGTDTLVIELTTGTAGAFTGTLSFTTNDLDENPFNFTINGGVRLAPTLPGIVDTTTGGHDLTIYGAEAGDNITESGALVIGDVNGDGVDDIVIGAQDAAGPGNARVDAGEAYVYYGSPSMAGTTKDIAGLAGTAPNLIIYGADPSDTLTGGNALALADVNGDKIKDIILGSSWAAGPANARGGCGETYIILGASSLPAVIDLATGAEDVTIYGAAIGDNLNYGFAQPSIRSGDFNADGFDDLLLRSRTNIPNGSWSGAAYIVFGSNSLPGVIDFATSGENVTIYGASTDDLLADDGNMAVGDVNGDGFDDAVIGAFRGDGPGETRSNAGEAYIIYGSAAMPAVVNLATSGENVTIYGRFNNDNLTEGGAVTVGDLNGDGISDVILGADNADGPTMQASSSGEAYVIFGSPSLPSVIDLAAFDQDITIFGATGIWATTNIDKLTQSGSMKTGDIDGDGRDDLMLGAYLAWSLGEGRRQAGEAYVVFGAPTHPSTIELKYGEEDITVYGATGDGANLLDNLTLNNAILPTDFDGDGIRDFILGSGTAAGPGDTRNFAGETYVILGRPSYGFPSMDLFTSAEDMTIYGSKDPASASLFPGDQLNGYGALRSGDVNDDGRMDIIMGAWVADGPADARIASGDVYGVFGEGPSPTALVRRYNHPGNPLPSDYGTARVKIDYNGGAATSLTSALLTRNNTGISFTPPSVAANVHWFLSTDRTGWSATVTFHYLQSEVALVSEYNMKLYQASSLGGPYVEIPSVVNPGLNTVTATVTSFGYFILASVQPEMNLREGAVQIPSGGGPINFGTVAMGAPNPSRTFTVENFGPGALHPQTPALPAGFLLAEGISSPIAVSGSDNFTLELSTAAGGVFSGPVSIPNDDPDENPYTFSVTGTVISPSPTPSPTASPTASPTPSPTRSPTISPTASRTPTPTRSPTLSPTPSRTASPTRTPTGSPTRSPTASPSATATQSPSPSPTASPSPTESPTATPSPTPNAVRDWSVYE